MIISDEDLKRDFVELKGYAFIPSTGEFFIFEKTPEGLEGYVSKTYPETLEALASKDDALKKAEAKIIALKRGR